MTDFKLIRIDVRLIHGQIVVQWIKAAKVTQIVIIDDELASDAFMIDFYKKTAPSGIKVWIYNIHDACEIQKEKPLVEGNALLLLKDVDVCYRLFKESFPMNHVQLGNVPSGPLKKAVSGAVYLTSEEYLKLEEINQSGIRVYIQPNPSISPMDLKTFSKKFN